MMLQKLQENGPRTADYAAAACIEVIGVHAGLGGSDPDTRHGPKHLRAAGVEAWLSHAGLQSQWHDIHGPRSQPEDPAQRLAALVRINKRLSGLVKAVVSRGNRFLVLGGDHSCGIGTWSGAARALRGKGPLGLIWIDAHMDSHVPETSPSGNWHGMPLAHLLGYGEAAFISLARPSPALAPEKLCLIGQRSWETAEVDLLSRLKVRVIAMPELKRIGVHRAIREASERVSRGTAGFGISLDVDAIDPDEAPGAGSPVPGGIKAADLDSALAGIAGNPKFLGLEIVEFDPHRDRHGQTAGVIRRVLTELLRPGGD